MMRDKYFKKFTIDCEAFTYSTGVFQTDIANRKVDFLIYGKACIIRRIVVYYNRNTKLEHGEQGGCKA